MKKKKRVASKRLRRWTVIYPEARQYLGDRCGITWSRNLQSVRELARYTGGKVVDANWFSANWNEWLKTGIIPKQALPKGGGN